MSAISGASAQTCLSPGTVQESLSKHSLNNQHATYASGDLFAAAAG
jgi:hypothetical protein